MKQLIYLVLIAILFTSCAHRIVRTGYDKNTSKNDNCDVRIKKNIEIADTIALKIGEIKLGETGFSVSCNEKHAIRILKNEACALKADIILITEENRSNFWSTCYRCRAEFYRYKTDVPQEITQDEVAYNTDKVNQRVSADRKRNVGNIFGTVAVWILLMLMMN